MAISPQQLRDAVLHWGAQVLRCHAADCSAPRRAWDRLSSRSRTISLHGRSYCFPQCFEGALRQSFATMQRERVLKHRPMYRVPLGLLMLSRADLTSAQLRHALAEQDHDAGLRIGECMQRLGYVSEPQLTAALAAQWSCPVLHVMPQQLRHCGLPHGLLERFQMLPVHFVSATRTLHIAFASEIAYRALVAASKCSIAKRNLVLLLGQRSGRELSGYNNIRRPQKSTSPAASTQKKWCESLRVMRRGLMQRTSNSSPVMSWLGSESKLRVTV